MEEKSKIGGRPIYITFSFVGGNEVEYQLVCPICGTTEFVFSTDKELGGCTNEGCSCICFERVKDSADLGGVKWMI